MTKDKIECLHCGDVITDEQPICEADGVSPHTPTPTEMGCEGCGEQISFSMRDDEKHCSSCVREYEQEEIHRNWSYYNA